MFMLPDQRASFTQSRSGASPKRRIVVLGELSESPSELDVTGIELLKDRQKEIFHNVHSERKDSSNHLKGRSNGSLL